jgi:hypothetical protein
MSNQAGIHIVIVADGLLLLFLDVVVADIYFRVF